MPMFSEQRKTEILSMLTDQGSVSLGELMEKFSVSEATVRRDLTELEALGRLRRTHGGAVPRNLSLYESSYAESKLVNVESKVSIARACEKLVRDNHTVLLDSGTTTFEIAKILKNKNITLFSNSVTVVAEFVENGAGKINFISTGGLVRSSFRAFVGSLAEEFVQRIVPDITFISANGFSLEHGASTPDVSEAGMKRAMLKCSKRAYLVIDSTKEGNDYFSVIADLKAFDGVITDSGISDKTREALQRAGVQVITE